MWKICLKLEWFLNATLYKIKGSCLKESLQPPQPSPISQSIKPMYHPSLTLDSLNNQMHNHTNFVYLTFSLQILRPGKMIIFKVQGVRCIPKPYHLHLPAWHSHKPASKTLEMICSYSTKLNLSYYLLYAYNQYIHILTQYSTTYHSF